MRSTGRLAGDEMGPIFRDRIGRDEGRAMCEDAMTIIPPHSWRKVKADRGQGRQPVFRVLAGNHHAPALLSPHS